MARSKFLLAILGDSLDPRPAALAEAQPLHYAASIPFDELPARLHELPPKHQPIRVVGGQEWADRAIAYLRSGGRGALQGQAKPREVPGSPFRLWRPNEFLESILHRLKGRSGIDLACGNGREAVALAGTGFWVDACDWSEEALVHGRELARRYLWPRSPGLELPIQWLRIDLEKDGPPDRTYDLAVSFRYLHRPLLAKIANLLNENGSFVMETFTTLHRERHGKPRSDAFVLQPAELPTLISGLEIQHYDEAWRADGSHTARLWARKL